MGDRAFPINNAIGGLLATMSCKSRMNDSAIDDGKSRWSCRSLLLFHVRVNHLMTATAFLPGIASSKESISFCGRQSVKYRLPSEETIFS